MFKRKGKIGIKLSMTLVLVATFIMPLQMKSVSAAEYSSFMYRVDESLNNRKVVDLNGNVVSGWSLCMNKKRYETDLSATIYRKISNAGLNEYQTYGTNANASNFQQVKRLLYFYANNAGITGTKYSLMRREYDYITGQGLNYNPIYSDDKAFQKLIKNAVSSSDKDDEINKNLKITIYEAQSTKYQNVITATYNASTPEEVEKPDNDDKSDIIEVEAPKATVKKVLEFVEGITVPNYTFNFTADKITADAPNAKIEDIRYSNIDDKGTVIDGKFNVVKESEIKFDGDFPHAGLYEYKVKETAGNDKGITYSTKEYTLRVYVVNFDDGSTYIDSITAEDENGEKPDNLSFTNTYEKNGGDDTGENKALVVEKQTVGDLADKTKDFTFKLTLTKAKTAKDEKIIGKIGNEEVEFTYGVEKEFQLHDGEQLVFENLPAGTRYNAVEVGEEDGYTPTVKVIENGTKNNDVTGTDADDLSSATAGQTNLVGEKENKVTFVNTYKEVAVTGIITNNMPFIVLAGLSASAFIVLAVAKKKKMSK